MAEELWTNNAATTLAADISPTATVATLASGTGALFPSPGSGEFFRATLFSAGSTSGTPNEIVYVTARSTDTVTIERGQEGTTPTTWNAGDSFSNYFTAGAAAQFAQQPDVQAQAGNWADDSGSANAGVVALSPVPVSLAALQGVPIRVKKSGANTGAYTLAVNGFAATAVTFQGGALAAGDLPAGFFFSVMYDGAVFELQTMPGNGRGGPPSGAAGGILAGTYPNPSGAANGILNAYLATVPASTLKGNATTSTATPTDLTTAQVLAMLGIVVPTVATFQNQQSSGSDSGESLTNSAWTQRTLNATAFNSISGASLAGNEVTLPAGTYVATGFAQAGAASAQVSFLHKARLATSAGAVLIDGVNAEVTTTGDAPGFLQGAFSLASATAVQVMSFCHPAAIGGIAVSTGDPEVYVNVTFLKIA